MKIFLIFNALLVVAISASATTVVQKNWEMDRVLTLEAGIKVSVKVVDYLCGGQPEITLSIPDDFNKRKYKGSGFIAYKESSLLVSSNLVSGKIDERNNEVFFCIGLELLPSTQVEIHYGVGEHITDTLILRNLDTYANQPDS